MKSASCVKGFDENISFQIAVVIFILSIPRLHPQKKKRPCATICSQIRAHCAVPRGAQHSNEGRRAHTIICNWSEAATSHPLRPQFVRCDPCMAAPPLDVFSQDSVHPTTITTVNLGMSVRAEVPSNFPEQHVTPNAHTHPFNLDTREQNRSNPSLTRSEGWW